MAERVGPYELGEPLGRGGLAVVFRAVDVRTGREVALKRLLGGDARARARLAREARALLRLRHAHVVSLLDAGEDAAGPWLALELVRGRSLAERLARDGPLPAPAAARLVQAVATGLAHAHREGVLHRDLTPGNVLLTADGTPKLTDFGLAALANAPGPEERLTRSGAALGTPGYWAPEQVAGHHADLGPRTDVYGLGALLHACLTGRPPIEAETFPETLLATARRRPEPSGVDAGLDAIAARCLEKDPAARYPSADAVARALARHLAGGGRGRRRRRLAVAAGAAAVVAGAALLARAGAPPGTAAGPGAARVDPGAGGAPVASALGPTPAAVATGAATEDALAALLARADARFRAGDFRGAAAAYDEALALDPRHAVAHARRAAMRANLGDDVGAVEDFGRAIELGLRGARAYANRGAARTNLGDLRGALADFDQALALAPDDAEVLALRGAARASTGDPRGALADLDRALALDPRAPSAHRDRGAARAQLGDLQGALTDLDQALALDPRDAHALGLRGAARVQLRDDRGALADLDQALALEPRDARARRLRGAARARQGDLRGALADFDRVVAQEPSNALAHEQRATTRALLGDHAGAVADYEQALRLAPGASWAEEARARLAASRAALRGD